MLLPILSDTCRQQAVGIIRHIVLDGKDRFVCWHGRRFAPTAGCTWVVDTARTPSHSPVFFCVRCNQLSFSSDPVGPSPAPRPTASSFDMPKRSIATIITIDKKTPTTCLIYLTLWRQRESMQRW